MTRSTPAVSEGSNEPAPANTAAARSPLTQRYVAVTLAHVPVTQHATVESSLRSAITSEIEHRYDRLLGDENITWGDLEVDVLEDMGNPERVAAAMTDRPLFLIGPKFFLDFIHVLVWLVVIVSPVAALLSVASSLQQGATTAWLILDALGAAVTAGLYAAALTTIGFAVAERVSRPQGQTTSAAWTIDKLPRPPRRTIAAPQTTTRVVAPLLLAVAIIWQQIRPSVVTEQSQALPFLNPSHWPWLWCGVVALLGVQALAAIARHVLGYWTLTWATVNLVLVSALGGLLAWGLLDHTFLNDAFFDEVGWPTDQLSTATLETWTAGVVAVLWAVSVALGFARAFKARALRAREESH